jgi:hypothetical protein
MCPQKNADSEDTAVHGRGRPPKSIPIDRLADLDPYAESILETLNADSRLLLLAAVDAPGVLNDLGYKLSPQAARDLRHSLPKMTREQRDRYLIWLRGSEDVSRHMKVRLVQRKSGSGLLGRTSGVPLRTEAKNASAGEGTGGFDIVVQFGEAFCDRMVKRNYAFGYLPRSVYRIGNALHYFYSRGEYDSLKLSGGSGAREVHFYQPALTFPMAQADKPRLTSVFVAEGFGEQMVEGTAAVDAGLSVKKDSKNQPEYLEVSFNGLSAADVSVKLTAGSLSAAASAELCKMILDAYKGFGNSAAGAPGIPLTFMLVDGDAMAGLGATETLDVTAGIRQPAGAAKPLLMVGASRPSSAGTGDLDSVPNGIQKGGDFALLQDSKWLEKSINQAFASALPVRIDPDSGLPDPDSNMRLDSIVWNYRSGGLTGNITAVLENAYFYTDAEQSGEAYLDIAFHNSEPTCSMDITCEMKELECWQKFLVVLWFVLAGIGIGVIIGGVIGGVVGGVAGIVNGAILGGIVGFSSGLMTGLALVGWAVEFDVSGMRYDPAKNNIKVTHSESLPVTSGSVTVRPNDFAVTENGTLLSAALIGPKYAEPDPTVVIKGSYSAEITPPGPSLLSEKSSGSTDADASNPSIAHSEQGLAAQDRTALHRGDLVSAVVGTITLDYSVISTSGLQGTLEYLWSFNGTSIGDSLTVKVVVPVSADMVKGFEYNKANVLGMISVTITDSFGRKGTAAETVTVGNPQNLRSAVPALMETRGYIDPIERAGRTERGDPVSIVGWQAEGDSFGWQMGALNSIATVSIGGKDYAIVGTQKV